MATDPALQAARDAGVLHPAVLQAPAQDLDKPWIVYGPGSIVDTDAVSPETMAYWRSTGRVSPSVEVAITLSNVVATPDAADGTLCTITWDTNVPADSQVQYGADASYGSSSVLEPGQVTSHTVQLSGLTAATSYHFSAQSGGVASPDGTFTTAAEAAP